MHTGVPRCEYTGGLRCPLRMHVSVGGCGCYVGTCVCFLTAQCQVRHTCGACDLPLHVIMCLGVCLGLSPAPWITLDEHR